MALLVEGLGVGAETTIEEYIIGPDNDMTDDQDDIEKEKIKLYGPEEGLSWVARPVSGQSMLGHLSRRMSMENRSTSFVDPMVALFGSIHENLPGTGSMRSALFPNFGSMFSVAEQNKHAEWDEESLQREGEDFYSEAGVAESDDNLQSPLLSRQTSGMEAKDMGPTCHGSILSMGRNSSCLQGSGEAVSSMGIGGGWQLAWKWSEHEGEDGKKGGFKRIYLHQEGGSASRRGSLVSIPGISEHTDSEYIQAAALVSQPALYSKELLQEDSVGPAMVHPSEAATKGPKWKDLLEPGVKRALFVGIGIQILQQACCISFATFIIECLLVVKCLWSFLNMFVLMCQFLINNQVILEVDLVKKPMKKSMLLYRLK